MGIVQACEFLALSKSGSPEGVVHLMPLEMRMSSIYRYKLPIRDIYIYIYLSFTKLARQNGRIYWIGLSCN